MRLPTTLGYRPEIDGLRAIAVLSVLAFHYGAPVPGGFTGVDVFFVISGFLITRILAADIAADRFSVLGFYDRRVRRILPALLAMLAASLIAGAFLLQPGDYVDLAASGGYAAVGVSNFFFLYNTGYFDQVVELIPLLHTWSLAVEEQFYLAWPLMLVVLAAGRSRAAVAVTIGAIVAICCAGSIAYFYFDPKAAFYLPLLRAWELGLGALLVFVPPLSRGAGALAICSGLALIGAGFAVVSPDRFPGAAALYPCVGAALVIWPRAQGTTADRVLGTLAPIGLISYSLYLWHWPLWVFFRIYINNAVPTAAQASVLAAVSMLLAAASYRYIEQPFRRPRWTAPRTVAVGLAGVAAMLFLSVLVQRSNGLPQRVPAEAQAMRSRNVMWDWPCSSSFKAVPGIECVFGAPWETATRKTMIWGDSHAEHFAPIIDAVNTDRERSFVVFSGCSAVLGGELSIVFLDGPQHMERCKTLHAAGLKVLKEDPAVTQVILTSSWLDLPERIGQGDASRGLEGMRRELTRIIRETSAPGREFVLTGTVPEIPRDVVECAHTRSSKLWRQPCRTVVSPSDAAAAMRKSQPIDAMFKELVKTLPRVSTVTPADELCTANGCEIYLNGEFLYMDPGHIRRNLRLQTRKALAERIGLTAALSGPVRAAVARSDGITIQGR